MRDITHNVSQFADFTNSKTSVLIIELCVETHLPQAFKFTKKCWGHPTNHQQIFLRVQYPDLAIIILKQKYIYLYVQYVILLIRPINVPAFFKVFFRCPYIICFIFRCALICHTQDQLKFLVLQFFWYAILEQTICIRELRFID